jgi:hypothetical protein
MNEKKIIQIFLFFNFLIFFYGYLEGFFKPYWFDEVLTISLAKNIKNLSIYEIFTQDTHSPFFYSILFLFIEILNFLGLKKFRLFNLFKINKFNKYNSNLLFI